MPEIAPLALPTVVPLRPDGPSRLGSAGYARDVRELSRPRTPAQSAVAWFWTDLDVPQWNRALLLLALARRLDANESARMLATANVAGADAMIACFDAKYHYMFWRPVQAIPGFAPLFPTPPFPEYPSAHSCHAGAITHALDTFFGGDRVRLTLDSLATTPPPAGCGACVPGITRSYDRLSAAMNEIVDARVWAGFHFRHSNEDGAKLGRRVSQFGAERLFGRG
jgi:hypothetical protein